MNSSLRRFAVPVVFLIVLGLTIPTAGFAAPAGGPHWPDWLGFLSHLWAPAGCNVDPVGGCTNASTPAPRDQGCGVDPVGRCAEASTTAPRDEGCMLEPVGRCAN